MSLPYLTDDLPGIGGQIKQRVEDFSVTEIPLYQPCGEGTHVYFGVTKTGIPTPVAVNRIARHMAVRPGDIGVAGLKDAQALTSQTMSLEHVDPDKLGAYRDHQMRIEILGRHGNKLRIGHLKGNRFAIRIRRVGQDDLDQAERITEVLARRGVPNFFGPQRFGARGDTASLGEALVKGELDEFIAIYLGRAQPNDPPDCKAARDAFDTGYYPRALKCWPRHYGDERRALSAYRKKKRPAQALAAIDKRMRRFYVSAFQSQLFNEVLAERIATIDQVMDGDLARKEETHGVFTVEAAQIEQPRAIAFEISPTGPIVGYRSPLAAHTPGKIEQSALSAHGITQEDFRRTGSLKVKGARRSLRAKIESPELISRSDEFGSYLEASFTLPSGCYATVVLREIMKND